MTEPEPPALLDLTEPVVAPIAGGSGQTVWWHLGLDPALGELVAVNFARTRARKRQAFPPHRANLHELILVRRGSYRARVDDASLRLGPRDLLLVAPGASHEDIYPPGTETFGIQFVWQPKGRKHWPGESLLPDRVGARRGRLASPFSWKRLENLAPGPAGPGPFHGVRTRLAILDLLYELLLHGFQPSPLLPGAGAADTRRMDLKARIEKMFHATASRNLSVAEMAKAVGLTPDRFARKAEHALGAPPARAHLHFRLELARSRLLQDDEPLSDVADAFGFASPFHFSRVFKARYGVSPSRLRGMGGPATGTTTAGG